LIRPGEVEAICLRAKAWWRDTASSAPSTQRSAAGKAPGIDNTGKLKAPWHFRSTDAKSIQLLIIRPQRGLRGVCRVG
jgi:hypothetical protein